MKIWSFIIVVVSVGLLIVLLWWMDLRSIHAELQLNKSVEKSILNAKATPNVSSIHYKTEEVQRCGFLGKCQSVSAVTDFRAFETVDIQVFRKILRLQWINHLGLVMQDIDSTAIRDLQAMPKLRDFNCLTCEISGEPAANCVGPMLSRLNLTGSMVTKPALEALICPGTVRELHLSECDIDLSPELVKMIVDKAPHLEMLYLVGTRLSDAAASQLGDLQFLQEIYLGKTEIRDVTLQRLSELRHLRSLHIPETNVTDEGIRSLADCKSLRELTVTNCPNVSIEALESLQRMIPDLSILSK